MPPLSQGEIARYARHLLLPEVGIAGQERLRGSSVLVVGAGGLGSPAALYLAAAGVGRIGLADFDAVDASNLQRQVLYGTSDVGRPKVDAAVARLSDLNPGVALEPLGEKLVRANALDVLARYDVVLDGTDNFATRYLVNDACVLLGKPNVWGSVYRFEGQVSVFWRGKGPCYRCLYPQPPEPGLVPSCAEGGVLGVLPGVVGALQAAEALKVLLGAGRPLVGRLLLYDGLAATFRTVNVPRDPACPICGDRPTLTGLDDYDALCAAGAPALSDGADVTPRDVAGWRAAGEDVQLLDVREPAEAAVARIAGSVLVPLGSLPSRLGDVDRSRRVVVYCRTGARSARAVELLRRAGLTRTYNLAGGILAWARDVDPTLSS